jgi:hypothetical protein
VQQIEHQLEPLSSETADGLVAPKRITANRVSVELDDHLAGWLLTAAEHARQAFAFQDWRYGLARHVEHGGQ